MRITLPNGKWRKRLKIKALPPFAELHKVRAGNYKMFELTPDIFPEEKTVEINYADGIQVVIEGNYWADYALADIYLYR